MLNHSDATLWVVTAAAIVVISSLAGFVYAKGTEPKKVPCSAHMTDGVGIKHEWEMECKL